MLSVKHFCSLQQSCEADIITFILPRGAEELRFREDYSSKVTWEELGFMEELGP